ncbi:MAG TPA: lysine--tRNA ligase, partial [Syntrophomonas sp.]|nr:lysine--tRNA ligase [Syntrophomonas sp.]
YQAYADYEDMMELTEELISRAAFKVNGSMQVEFEGQIIDFSTPWKRVQMLDAIKEHTGLDFRTISDDETARTQARSLGLEVDDTASRGEIINEVFEARVEEQLIQPTFV